MSLVHHEGSALFRSERQEYRIIYALSFPLFLAVALISRFVPARLRPIAVEPGSYFAVFSDARAAAHSVLPYAFMR
ncbi:hypothetical protein [Aurantimonas sp. VKM B-3413]|uniref:hypothetical protein n=1 Tax=Aurantimonas sp. VKM B-3413 TaxID=2779401 RepID=UPI001E59FF45|nr:hypothetical protein [Aurantimonas sp. VKM B-3413]MCB8839099.1 hypothetical protein [Aurantimonas sp. VKM B-3413]